MRTNLRAGLLLLFCNIKIFYICFIYVLSNYRGNGIAVKLERLEKQLAEVREKLSNTLRLCKDYIEAKRLEPNTQKECIYKK